MDISDPVALQSGLYPSLARNTSALWRDGTNVLFADGAAEKVRGPTQELITPAPAPIVALAQEFTALEKRLYYATAAGVWKWANGASTAIGSGFTGTDWSLEPFGTQLLATNNRQPLQVWRNTGLLVNNPGFVGYRAFAKIVKKLANFVLCYNTDQGGNEVIWSDQDNPEVWNITEENAAGEFVVRDLDSDIAAVCELVDGLAFYSSDSMGLTTYIGAPFYFSNVVKLHGIGAVSKDSVVSQDRFNYGLGPNGFWQTDGYSYSYVDNPAVNRWFKENVRRANLGNCRAFSYEDRNMVVWFFDCVDGTRKGLAYNYQAKSWGILQMPVTAAIGQQVFDAPFVAQGTTFGYFDRTSGATLPADLSTSLQDAGSRNNYKSWELLRVDVDGQVGPLEFRIGFSDTPDEDDLDWTDWTQLDYENWFNREAVFAAVEFRSNAPGSEWRITGMSVHGEVLGYL